MSGACAAGFNICPCCVLAGVYDADGGHGENTFGWKSLGQELRINDVTADLPSFQHGHRALASKDMRKSQGGRTHTHTRAVCPRRQ